MFLPQLRRVRWAVRATLVLGVAASVSANILHALDNPISQAIAAWPPLALLLTVELISRVPVHRRSLTFARLVATATIASIAAWVSYWHMAGVAARYGETGASPYLLPLSVDGLIVVASICLVELGGQISTLEAEQAAAARAESAPPRAATASAAPIETPLDAVPGLIPVPAAASGPIPAAGSGRPRSVPSTTAPDSTPPARRVTAAALAAAAAALPRDTEPGQPAGRLPAFTPTLTRQGRPAAAAQPAPSETTSRAGSTRSAPRSTTNSKKTGPRASARPGSGATAAKARRSQAETVALATRIKADLPDLTDAELAAELGISTSRWRTIRREAEATNLSLAA